MQTRTYRRTFAGGEITPELFGNFELVRNQTGLQTCLNFRVTPHGTVENRPGMQFIQRVKDSSRKTRIVPFNYNTEQTYLIEFGHQYIRFHTNDATLLEGSGLTITGISQADPGVLTYTGTDPANGTWMYLESIAGMTQLNGRYVIVANVNAGANTFELTDLFGNDIDTSGFTAYSSGGTATAVYEVASPYVEADLFDIHFVQSADVLTLVHPSHAPRELSRLSATSWSLAAITFAPTISAPTGVGAAATSGSGSTSYTYKVTAISSDGLEESLESSSASVNNDLNGAGAYNTVSWTAVSGAIRYNVFKLSNGVYGYIGQAGGTSFIDNNITPDISITPPNNVAPFGSTDNYPAAVSYSDQRRVFGGTNTRRQTSWMTRAGTEKNLAYSIPTRDDDSIIFTLAAREANAIRHYVPLGDLLALTASAAWRISSADQTVLTPTSVQAKPQAYVGASNVQPVVSPASILYVQSKGTHVYELVYSGDNTGGSNGYKVSDLSLMAHHLFPKSAPIVDLAYSDAPGKWAWAVREDGIMLGMTYVPDQQVIAWHQHSTDGLFESVAVSASDAEDFLYAVVKRTINGAAVRYIEKMHSREFTTLADAFFVDSGLTYEGSAATTISGLYHLEGEEVAVLADGAVHPPVTVENGAITLEQSASKVHIGLPITADLQLLPAVAQVEAFGQGRPQNINEIWLRLYRSSGVFAGPSFSDLTELPPREYETYGSPPALKTGEYDLKPWPTWGTDADLCIRQTDPLPLTLSAITMEVEMGG